jgi:hypothetical protein
MAIHTKGWDLVGKATSTSRSASRFRLFANNGRLARSMSQRDLVLPVIEVGRQLAQVDRLVDRAEQAKELKAPARNLVFQEGRARAGSVLDNR